jgi:hypothetical protein
MAILRRIPIQTVSLGFRLILMTVQESLIAAQEFFPTIIKLSAPLQIENSPFRR